MNNSTSPRKRIILLIIAIVILFIAWAAWATYYSTVFHVVNTTPSTSNVSTISPFIKINFNENLSNKGWTISDNPGSISSSSVSGKTITVNLSYPLSQNTKYTITINSIYDVAGKKLTNLKFIFTPKYVPYTSLPQNQQNAILNNQSQAAQNQAPTFVNTNYLINQGLSTNQIKVFEQEITSFANSAAKVSLSTATVDPTTVATGPINSDGTFSISFTVGVNQADYKAKFQYAGVTDGELFMYDTGTGAQIYDSGVVNL